MMNHTSTTSQLFDEPHARVMQAQAGFKDWSGLQWRIFFLCGRTCAMTPNSIWPAK